MPRSSRASTSSNSPGAAESVLIPLAFVSTVPATSSTLRPFAIAVAIGLLIGFEREHRQWREHGEQTPAGTRTMAVVALAGAIAATLDPLIVAAGLIAVAGLIGAAGLRSASPDLGTTTPVTAITAFLLGALTVDDARLSVALGVVLAVVLESKRWVRSLIRDVVSPEEVEDAVRWFALAFVILPLMPDDPVGPSGSIVPSRIWELLVLLTGVGWVGYVATRTVGHRRGLLVIGATGGFVSGAATTAALARFARRDPSMRRSALGGSLLASVATCVQIVILAAFSSRDLGRRLLAPMAVGSVLIAATALITAFGLPRPQRAPRGVDADGAGDDRRTPATDRTGDTERSAAETPSMLFRRPLALRASLAASAVLTAAVTASSVLVDRVGTTSAVAAVAATGVADVHAATLAVAQLQRSGRIDMATAVNAVGIALLTNTGTKLAAAATGGWWFLSRFACALVPAGIGIAVTLVLWS